MAALLKGGLEGGDLMLWQRSLDIYPQVIDILNNDKIKKKKKGGKRVSQEDTLTYLDSWYQNELPKDVSSRVPPHLTADELVSLMKWKLTRGKFRPRLTEMVKENSHDTVIDITSKAFSQLPNVRKAIEILTKLKAVGPATASAILCVVSPQNVPFMSDESTQAVPGIGPLNYSLKQYMEYTDAMCRQASKLGEPWTAHKVELALWSYQIASQLKPELLEFGSHSDNPTQDSEPVTKKLKSK